MIFHPITRELMATPRVQASDFLRGLFDATIALYPDGIPLVPWGGYLAEQGADYVGVCAFKTPPVDGVVEIAYFTFPDFEGRGVATQMAQHLVHVAGGHGVARVIAQTLPQQSASTRILEKLGFAFAGSVQHPEDGTVWEWHKAAMG